MQYASSSTSAEGRTTWISIFPISSSPAPVLFTELLKPLLGSLWKGGVRIIIYLDDALILAGQSELDFFVLNIWLLR